MTNHPNTNRPSGGEMTPSGKSVFTGIKTAAKKALRPSSKNDHSLPNAIAAIHVENSRILNRVGRFVKDQPGIEDPEETDQEFFQQGSTLTTRREHQDVPIQSSGYSTINELDVHYAPIQSINYSTINELDVQDAPIQPGSSSTTRRDVQDAPTHSGSSSTISRLAVQDAPIQLGSSSTTTRPAVQDAPIQSGSSSTTKTLLSRMGLTGHPSNGKNLSNPFPDEQPRKAFFLRNHVKPLFRTPLPKTGHRFNSTLQLAFAHHLLPKELPSSSATPGSVATTCSRATEMVLNEAEETWVATIEQDTARQDDVRALTAQVVAEFLNTLNKDAASIAEVILLGPVLGCEDYRSVLSSLIAELESQPLLKVKLLQGLNQLLQEALPGYLIDDDLARVLQLLRQRLAGTFKRLGDAERSASDHIYHLVITISRVLDALVEGNIKGLQRTEHHQPLLEILNELRDSSDPCLKFHASYAWQALQYVGDDESPLHAALRFGGGLTRAALSVASVFKFDPENLFSGLQQLGQAAGQAYDVTKTMVEGAQALRAGGEGIVDSMWNGFQSGAKRAWYPALQGARVCILEGRLADFERIIYEAPCRRELEFQQGVCHLLGEVALDPIWEIKTRKQAVDFLQELFMADGKKSFHAGAKKAILGILGRVSENAEQIIRQYTKTVLEDLPVNSTDTRPRTYIVMVRLPQPTASPLLFRALRVSALEDKLRQMMTSRRDEYRQGVYIPPQGKAIHRKLTDEPEEDINNDSDDESTDESDNRPFSLVDKVMEFFKSDQQVFLILGDSGSGKSTFNRHLEHQLLKSYIPGGHIPILIILPAIASPEKELIQEHLKMYDFSEDEIRDLKQSRQFIVICDGYDESQLSINLHTTNLFNRAGQWNVKMVIGCRNTYLGKSYRERFEPQPVDCHNPATPHLFQEAVIVPFSGAEIEDYVEQFVRDTEVHELFDGRPVWNSEDYMDKLDRIPKLRSLVKNPFLLVLVLRALPVIVDGVLDLKKLEVTRARIYEVFIEQWLEINRKRLRTSKHTKEETEALEGLIGEGFTTVAIKFLKDLALAIFKEQDGNPVVRYVHRVDKMTWKAKFFGLDPEVILLRDASPLRRSGVLYRFIHRSFLEYFYDFLEQNIFQLRIMRLREYERLYQELFIPCYAKPGFQDSDGAASPLMVEVQKFLKTDGRVFLLLGDSGSGKSMFNRHLEYQLWSSYSRGDTIPLHINLPAIPQPDQDLIAKQLTADGFKDDQIQELKLNRQFTVICDGYDEIQFQKNLYESNLFNRPGQWKVKMVISCRSTYLGHNYRHFFEPVSGDNHTSPITGYFREAVIVPFSSDQITQYVGKFVRDKETPDLFDSRAVWDVEEYMEKLQRIPNMMDLVKNPFLLMLSLKSLPSVYNDIPDVTKVKATRLMLYDKFIVQWIQASLKRIQSVVHTSSSEVQAVFINLVEEGFVEAVLNYSSRLAAHIVTKHDYNPIVQYGKDDKGSWKENFFGPDTRIKILRESSPIMRSGNQYRFIHRSLVEYFYSLSLLDQVDLDEPDVHKPGLRALDSHELVSNDPVSDGPVSDEPFPEKLLFLDESIFGEHLSEVTDAVEPSVSDNTSNVMIVFPDESHAKPEELPLATTASPVSYSEGTTLSPSRNSRSQKPNRRSPHTGHVEAAMENYAFYSLSKPNLRRSPQYGIAEYALQNSSTLTPLYKPLRKLTLAANNPLHGTALIKDPSTLQFLADRIQQDEALKSQYFATIERSKTDPSADVAAANAITLLTRAGERFSGMDLSGIRIPGADVSGGDFDSVQLVGANLTGVNLTRTWLRKVNFAKAEMGGVQFGEWPYMRQQFGMNACTYSPNGQLLAIGFSGGALSLFSTKTWLRVRGLDGHDWSITALLFSPDGRQLASASEDKSIKLWDVKSGILVKVLEGPTETVTSMAHSPMDDLLAVASDDDVVRIYDLDTAGVVLELKGHSGAVKSVAYSASGHILATASSDWTVRLWDPKTGAQQHVMRGHTSWVTSVSISPINNLVASSGQDMTVRLWDGSTGQALFILKGHTAFVRKVSFSPSGHQLASSSDDRTVRLWNGKTGAPGTLLTGHTKSVFTLAYSPDGKQIATCGRDSKVRLWDVNASTLLDDMSPFLGSAESVAYSSNPTNPTNPRTRNAHALLDQAPSTGQPQPLPSFLEEQESSELTWEVNWNDHSIDYCSVVLSGDGQVAASGFGKLVRLFDANTGVLMSDLRGHTDSVISLAFSPDRKTFVSGSHDKTARIWNIQTGKVEKTLEGHTEAVTAVAFSPTGIHIATGSEDRLVMVWSIRTGKVSHILSSHSQEVKSLSYSPDQHQALLASGSRDHSIKLWQPRDGILESTLKGHTDVVDSVSFSSTGQLLVSGSRDRNARVWDLSSNQTILELTGHRKAVSAVAFSPNNLFIATGSWDKTVKVWDAETGECLVQVSGSSGEVCSIAWKPVLTEDGDSLYLITRCSDRSVRMWKLLKAADGALKIQLHWRASLDGLVVSSANIYGVVGLTKRNKRLLLQRGAVNDS
ncbi:hypothetical protein BGZ96_002865 [Linnemannia gamsii]|uniref:WD40 repeat-like protein n=1 Tax=Linnemannia gamsii TaxID=64522 RepID=A0ABQ7K7J3_9FUNG|nr:hypothetical protein BGZ96_002865 [Linnemannia gamsii]